MLEVIAPGLLVIKQSRGYGSGKFVNVAAFQGDVKLINEQFGRLPGCPDLLSSLLGVLPTYLEPNPERAHPARSVNAGPWARRLAAVRALENRHVAGIRGSANPLRPGTAVFHAYRAGQDRAAQNSDGGWIDALGRAVDGVAGLTAVDGATVITDR